MCIPRPEGIERSNVRVCGRWLDGGIAGEMDGLIFPGYQLTSTTHEKRVRDDSVGPVNNGSQLNAFM